MPATCNKPQGRVVRAMECHKRVKLDPAAATDYWWWGDATPETVGGNMLTVPLKSFARKFIHDLLAEERAYDDGAATFRPLVRVATFFTGYSL